MKNDIHFLSDSLSTLSDEVQEKYDDLTTQISAVSSTLSNEVSAEIDSLSTWTDTNFIKKYGSQTSAIIKVQKFGDVDKNMIATSIKMTDGQIADITYDKLEDYITIDGFKVAGGTIQGDASRTETYTLQNANVTKIAYNVKADCYLNIEANVWEKDSSSKPLGVYLVNLGPDGTQLTAKLDQFNNPGGYSGTGYFNYYYSGFPIKQMNNGTESATSVVIEYDDHSKFAFDSSNKTTVKFTEYAFYATIAKSDLSNYVPRAVVLSDGSNKSLYKFKFNEFGLVTEGDAVTVDSSITSLAPATTTSLGMVKLGSSSGTTYGLKLNASNQAYVTVPKASMTAYGTIKIGAGSIANSTGLSSIVELSSNDAAYVAIPKASTTKLGIVKIGPAAIKSDSTGLIAGVQLSSTDACYVTIPAASTTKQGIVKVGSDPGTGTQTDVFIGTDGVAKVKYSTNLNFNPSEKTSLADSDKVLVNYETSNLKNFI